MSDFFIASKIVVTDFLQNVIIIDDETTCSLSTNSQPLVTEVNSPVGRGSRADFSALTTVDIIPSEIGKHSLNMDIVTNSFAAHGLLCSIVRPKNDEKNFVDNIIKVVRKADIIILDWNIVIEGNDPSATVKELIKRIVKSDESNKEKSMRYIAIYSGEENLSLKLAEIKSLVDDIEGMNEGNLYKYKLVYDYLQINIYAKRLQTGNTDPEIKTLEEELADKIINDFTTFICGIIPNMALKSLTEIRKSTHRLLTVFSKDLDESYLSHRAQLTIPSDAESLMIDILVSELHSILEDSLSIIEPLKIDNVMQWINQEFDENRLLKIFFNSDIIDHTKTTKHAAIKTKFAIASNVNLSNEAIFATTSLNIVQKNREFLLGLLKEIFSNNFENSSKFLDCQLIKDKKLTPQKFTSYLFRNDDHANTSENQFAMMTIVKNKYDEPRPYLSLGTILKNNENYFVCIIPRCDAARIQENVQSFPFLSLSPVVDDKKFDIVLKDNGMHKKFKIDYKPYNIYVQSFRKPIKYFDIKNIPLYADKINDKYIFFTHSDDCYIWISELKKEKAQSISNHFSAQLSRVGFNESEYLRRSYQ